MAMARNVEIKARLRDPERAARVAARLADGGPRLIVQHDRFYRAGRGRLKLRRFPGGGGELIAYDRSDRAGPRTSTYRLHRTDDPATLEAVLAAALVPAGEVRKRRRLYLVGRTRVHLDRVEGLGDFLELEVVLADGESEAAGRREAERLMAELGVAEADLVAGAYVDLLGAEDAGA
jgi:adenylate cyclase